MTDYKILLNQGINNDEVKFMGELYSISDIDLIEEINGKYTDAALRLNSTLNPLKNSGNLTIMFTLLCLPEFVKACKENEEFRVNVEILLSRIAQSAFIIMMDSNEKLKTTLARLLTICSTVELDIYQTFVATVTGAQTRVIERSEAAVTVVERRIFSAINYLKDDMKTPCLDERRSISTFDLRSVDAFLNSCERLGNKIETGAMMGDLGKLIETYQRAVAYYIYNVRKIEFAKGTTESGFFNHFFGTPEYKDVSLKFLEYAKSLYEIHADILRSHTSPIARAIFRFGNAIPMQFILAARTTSLTFDGDSFCLDEIKQRYSPSTIFAVLKPFSKDGRIEDYETIQENVLSKIQPYWWQKNAIDRAALGESFINVGPTSGGKTFCGMLIIAKLLSRAGGRNRRFIYSSPIDLLAIQTFASMYVSFREIKDNIAIICGCCVYIPPNANFFIGTPKELRDYFYGFPVTMFNPREELFVESHLSECVERSSIRRADVLIIDECHTISCNYNPTEEGRKVSKATEELLSMLYRDEGEQCGVFVGLSATLSAGSFDQLVHLVSEKTKIPHIERIYYSYPDIGRYVTPRESLEERAAAHELPQIRYPIKMSGGVIEKAEVSHELLTPIEITPQFIEKLIYKAKEENVLPLLMFFQTEEKCITYFRNFTDYVKNMIERSKWKALYTEYHGRMQSLTYEKQKKFQTDFISKIESIIMSHQSHGDSSHSIPDSIIKPMLRKYKRSSEKIFDENTFHFTIDLYALLIEYFHFMKDGIMFSCEVHPYYNFGDNGRTPTTKSDEDFVRLLESQDISVGGDGSNGMISTMMDGLRFGFSLISSSIPIGFQTKNSEIINSLKKDKDNVKSSVTFGDYGVSQGVDFPYKSVAIIRESLTNISASEFLQENGRCGRNTGDGVFCKSITFTCNIMNALEISTAEDLTFEITEVPSNFYTQDIITPRVIALITKIHSVLEQVRTRSILIDEFLLEEYFPGIDAIHQRSEKINLVKRELRELYELCKIVSPRAAHEYIYPLFRAIQNAGYSLIMSSAR